MKNEIVSVVVSVTCMPLIVPAYIGYYLFFAKHDKAPVKA